LIHHCHLELIVLPGGWPLYSLWIQTCINHHSIIHSGFPALKVHCALLIHWSLSSDPCQLLPFTFYIILPFPKCHTGGII
jgi:hypothetical protein